MESIGFTLERDFPLRLTIANSSDSPVVYKIKTTSPDKYKVRPSMYCLGAGSTNTVEIAAQSTTASALVRDKFLITAVTVEQEGVPATKIAEIMKVGFVCRNLFHACFHPYKS